MLSPISFKGLRDTVILILADSVLISQALSDSSSDALFTQHELFFLLNAQELRVDHINGWFEKGPIVARFVSDGKRDKGFKEKIELKLIELVCCES